MKKTLTLMAVLLWAVIGTAQNVGETAPDFTLTSLDGKQVSLTDYKGKVLLVFFFGNTCPSCISVSSSVKSRILDMYANNPNFAAIGVDVWNGNAAKVQSFKNATGLNIPLLLNGGGLASSWKTSYDRLVVIDRNGKMVFKGNNVVSSHLTQAGSSVMSELDKFATALERVSAYSKVLSTVYPNPVSISAKITFRLDEPGFVNLKVYDAAGKVVSELLNEKRLAGKHEVEFNRNNLPSGLYFYRIHTEGSSTTGKLVVE